MKDDAKPRHIGDIVRQLRISEGLTQKELARRSFFLSESTIRNIEKRGVIHSLQTLAALRAVPAMMGLMRAARRADVISARDYKRLREHEAKSNRPLAEARQRLIVLQAEREEREREATERQQEARKQRELAVQERAPFALIRKRNGLARLSASERAVFDGLRAGLIYALHPEGVHLRGPCRPDVPIDDTPRQRLRSLRELFKLKLVTYSVREDLPWIPAPYVVLILTQRGMEAKA